MEDRFNMPRLSPAGVERIRRAMERGHRGDDPVLPIRQLSLRQAGGDYISWRGPVDHGDGQEEVLWEMEIDFGQFQRGSQAKK